MAFVKVGERFWTAKTRTEVETQFGNADDFPKDSIVRIVTGADAGDYYWDPTSSATAGAGVIAVPGETGRFLLGASGTSTPSVSSSVAGSASAFTASQRRIFHSDGSTAGGVWTQLSSADVTGAFAAGAIGAGILAPGTNGQILTTSGGVATWAAPATVTSSTNGVTASFPSGQPRIFHSDGSSAGGTWDVLDATDVSNAFAAASIPTSKIAIGAGTDGQVIKIVSGVPTFADESGTGASPVTSSVSGTVNAFTASVRRIFHSDGTTAGGVWTQLGATDVTGAFAAGAIGAGIITAGSNGQVLTTSGGVATWAAPASTALVGTATAGTANQFPSGSRRVFHSDGTTAGGTWAQLDASDVTGAFAAGAIGSSILTPGTNGQVLTTSGGIATWAAPAAPLVSASVAGSANAFTASQRRVFHSDGTTSGGTWAQLAEVDVTGAFAAASIASGILKPGTNGQILTTSGGVATWAAAPTTPFVSSAVAGTAAVFPSGSRRIFHSDGTTSGGVWTQLTSTDVSGAFADASVAVAKLVAGTNGQILSTVAGVPTWSNPEFGITGAVNGDIIRRESGAWQRYALLNVANAPLMSLNGLPAWSPLNTAPTINLGAAATLTGFALSMAGHGDNRAIFLDATGNIVLNSIADNGFRHGPYAFINASDFNITLTPDTGTSWCGFISPTGAPIVLEPGFAALCHYYGEGSIRDFFVMQVFDTDGTSELMLPGDQGDLLTHNGSKWIRLGAAATDKYKLMSGGPSANPSWARDDDGATVILRNGYSGTERNIFGTWEAAFNAALAHGSNAKLYVEDVGTTVNVPGQVWDAQGRIGLFLANRTSSSSLQLSIGSSGEIQNITDLVAVTTHPVDTFPINIEVNGPTSTNNAGVYLGSFRGLTFNYSGKFNWTGARTYSIRVRNNHAVHMRELVHSGMGMRSNSDILLVVQNQVTPPALTSDSGTATLQVRQLAGSPLVASSFAWAGSGGVVITKVDDAKSLTFTPAASTNWPEGAPTEPSDALDKLAARNPGALPPGNQLFHGNYWFSFGKDTESLNISPNAESMAVWVPKFNHWLLLGMLSTPSDTSHNNLNVGVCRNFRRMNQQGFFRFDPSIGQQISSTFARPFTTYVIANGSGVRIVVSANVTSASTNHVVTSDDGGQSWTLRTGPFGSSTTGMHSMCWTGTTLVGVRSVAATTVGRSSNGTSWSTAAITSGTYLKVISNGNGTVVALRNGNTCMVSNDHGSTWSSVSIPSWSASFFDAIYHAGQFIILDNAGTAWTSPTGATWTPSGVSVSNPGKTSYAPYGWAYRSLVKCGGVLACLFKGTYAAQTLSEIFYSYDGLTWHDGGIADATYSSSYETSSIRFSTHLATSTPNSASDVQSNIHQMVCRMPGLPFDDFDTSSLFLASPAIIANVAGVV